MSVPVEGAAAWRASIERHHPIRAPNPADVAGGGGGAVSPWQALMTQAALARGESPAARSRASDTDWRPRIEPAPARETPPAKDSPDRIETASAATPGAPGVFETGEFSLAAVIDVINPLQHIPIVSTIYRELTGDQIGHAARLAGDVLFLGPRGGLTAMANILVQESSGKDIGEHALAMFKDDAPATAVANAPASAGEQNQVASAGEPNQVASASPAALSADEKALAELLPPGALPIPGRSIDFADAALRPAAFADKPAMPPAAASAASVDDDVPPPPPRLGPLAGPGWKGFYSPPEAPAPAAPVDTQRALPPDPMAALAARRTPGSMAAAVASTNRLPRELPSETGAIASEGGWFSDVMLGALAKYQDAQRLRHPSAPEAAFDKAPGGAVNVIN